MTSQEKLAFEQEIRNRIAEENRAKQRAYKAKWREQNREHGLLCGQPRNFFNLHKITP